MSTLKMTILARRTATPSRRWARSNWCAKVALVGFGHRAGADDLDILAVPHPNSRSG
jgi:hypothetical protein